MKPYPILASRMYAVACERTGPEEWVHICITAAAEAYAAVLAARAATIGFKARKTAPEVKELKEQLETLTLRLAKAERESSLDRRENAVLRLINAGWTLEKLSAEKIDLTGMELELEGTQGRLTLQAAADSNATAHAEAHQAASEAFRNNMPPLSSRANIQSFVCCITVGILRGYLTGKDANALLYSAQQALAAYPKRKRAAKKGQ